MHVVVCCKHSYISVAFQYIFLKIRNVLVTFPDHLNVETFLTHRSMVQSAIEGKDFQALCYITYKKMTSWEPDEIDFED